MQAVRNFFSNILLQIPTIGFADILDIAIVAFIFYKIFRLIHRTTAARIGKVIVALVVLTWVTEIAHIEMLHYLLSMVLQAGLLALVILFQPELRRFLERLGSGSIRGLFSTQRESADDMENVIAQTVEACEQMSQKRVGALIAFERGQPLTEFFKSGTMIEANVTSQLLRSLFFPNSALHDGAVILRNERIAAAGCVLPLTENTRISSDLGTRHRAGIGLSEASDAVVVIVSEESGSISVAIGGILKRHLAPQTLRRLLETELSVEKTTDATEQLRARALALLDKAKKLLRRKGDGDDR